MGICQPEKEERHDDGAPSATSQQSAPQPIVALEPPAAPAPAPAPGLTDAERAAKLKKEKEERMREEKARYKAASLAAEAPEVQFTKVFGCTVDEASKRSGGGLPAPVQECCRWIRLHGLQHCGLFRIPGRRLTVRYYKDLFNVDHTTEIPQDENVDTVASLVIAWIRELKDQNGQKEQLWCRKDAETQAVLHDLNRAWKDRAEGQDDVETLRSSLRQLSPIQVGVFAELSQVLREASLPENTAINKMTASNFAMCMLPELMSAVTVMIEKHDAVFQGFPMPRASPS